MRPSSGLGGVCVVGRAVSGLSGASAVGPGSEV